MGVTSKVLSACVRVVEFGCAGIIIGVLAKFFHILNLAGAGHDSRLVYCISIACISFVSALILLPPVKYSFYCFPLDFALFILWIVCFALLEDLSGTKTCQSLWFSDYWSFYWGNLWLVSDNVAVYTDFGCSEWRVVLAFSFVISMCFLFNGFLSLYVCIEYHELGPRTVTAVRKLTRRNPKPVDAEQNVTAEK